MVTPTFTKQADLKYERLKIDAEIESSAASSVRGTFDDAMRQVHAAETNLRRRLNGRRIDELGVDERKAFEAPVVDAKERLGRIKTLLDEASARFQTRFAFMAGLDALRFESQRQGVRFRDVAVKEPKPGDLPKQVEFERRTIGNIKASVEEALNAPAPCSELFADFLLEFERFADAGKPTLYRMRFDDEDRAGRRRPSRGGDPTTIMRTLVGYGGSHMAAAGNFASVNLGHLLAWLHRDAIIASARELIGTDDPPGALGYDERERLIGKLSADLLAAERREEALIVAGDREGISIPRRPDASPLAILEIEEV